MNGEDFRPFPGDRFINQLQMSQSEHARSWTMSDS